MLRQDYVPVEAEDLQAHCEYPFPVRKHRLGLTRMHRVQGRGNDPDSFRSSPVESFPVPQSSYTAQMTILSVMPHQ